MMFAEFVLSLIVAIGLLYWMFYTFAFMFAELLAEQPTTWRGGFEVGLRTLPKALVIGLLFVVLSGVIEPALAVGDRLREYHAVAKLAWASHHD